MANKWKYHWKQNSWYMIKRTYRYSPNYIIFLHFVHRYHNIILVRTQLFIKIFDHNQIMMSAFVLVRIPMIKPSDHIEAPSMLCSPRSSYGIPCTTKKSACLAAFTSIYFRILAIFYVNIERLCGHCTHMPILSILTNKW